MGKQKKKWRNIEKKKKYLWVPKTWGKKKKQVAKHGKKENKENKRKNRRNMMLKQDNLKKVFVEKYDGGI